ncbi:hypothetical protein BDN72DRAFT_394861 [Pluteus cervinus]|uniref:Uncharacterized protein n=1 Tax=Pluteus cervinus TaxID=181527 RepID=A0ACD3B1R0_9AGAR|nr:hypothetical protein BDN72DRAFT_394861 [Pluteus cervinus]
MFLELLYSNKLDSEIRTALGLSESEAIALVPILLVSQSFDLVSTWLGRINSAGISFHRHKSRGRGSCN